MSSRFRGKLSRRDQLLQNKRAIDFIAAAADKTYEFTTPIPDKRIRRPVDRSVILESAVNDEIYDTFKARDDVKLWRNNRGLATFGDKQVRYGVGPKGASDWIGYRKIYITQEHVGLAFAQFVALEAKRPGERPDEHQQRFIEQVNADGGWAGWADSAESAKRLIP